MTDNINYYVFLGGNWSDLTWHCRMSIRGAHQPSYKNFHFSVRLIKKHKQ